MVLAFKEWAYIVDALGKGRQSIIIRKGGISEDGGDFTVKGKKFLLFPTQFHQAREMIKPEWLMSLDAEKYFSVPEKVSIEYFAEIVDSKIIKDWSLLERLDSQHAWKQSVIMERFNRWEKSAHLLIVQVYKLNTPYELEMRPEYAGCKSWIELTNGPELAGTLVINQVLKGRF
jgi:hypothetical protein